MSLRADQRTTTDREFAASPWYRRGQQPHTNSCSRDAHAAPQSGNISTMGFLDRLLGRSTEPESRPRQDASAPSRGAPGELTDEQALERYRYLVRTAPPEAIEQAHEQAFAKLTPEQRRMALRDLSAAVPTGAHWRR